MLLFVFSRGQFLEERFFKERLSYVLIFAFAIELVLNFPQTQTLGLNLRFINDKSNHFEYLGRACLEWRIISDPNILYVCPEYAEELYPNKGKFTVEQLLGADMVKSAFSAGKRVEHMWVKVSEVQVENQFVKGTLDNTPIEITHLTFGGIVFVPFKDIEDIWIEGQVPESVKRLLEAKEDACMRAQTSHACCFRC